MKKKKKIKMKRKRRRKKTTYGFPFLSKYKILG